MSMYDVQYPVAGLERYERLFNMYNNQEVTNGPLPIKIFVSFTDEFCYYAGCMNWRDYVPLGLASPGSLLSLRVIRFNDINEMFVKPFPTFLDYWAQEDKSSCGFVTSLFNYAFSENTKLGDLTDKHALLVLFILVLLLRQLKATLLPLFSNYGRRIGRETHGIEWVQNNEEKIFKFGEYTVRLLCHLVLSVFGIWCFYDSAWWDPNRGLTKNLWINWPFQTVSPGMTWFYLIQATYHFESLLYLFSHSFCIKFNGFNRDGKKGSTMLPISIGWSDEVRGDFREMFIHHVVTNMLIFGSSILRAHRIGSMVFMVHDVSDVFVDLSKLANFVKWKKTLASVCMLCLLVWMLTRLGILPFIILYSCIWESHLLVAATQEFQCTRCFDNLYEVYNFFFQVGLSILILLHLYWFSLLMRIGYSYFVKNEYHDYSEHKSGEKQLLDDKKNGKIKHT